jgi:ribosomal protein S18 acetylase RimI-like enzyme
MYCCNGILMAGTLTNETQAVVNDGLRPIKPVSDMIALADLMEIGFGAVMDESGRASLREMRALGRAGWLARLLYGIDGSLGGFQQGFVWMANGRMVGNVSIVPAALPRVFGKGVVIANVVVHPDYQRQGIARELLAASLDLVRRQQRDFALLQVALDNHVAQRLYTQFGFRAERAFTHWVRPNRLTAPNRLLEMPPFTIRAGRDWQAEYRLAETVRPAQRGGLGWLRPTYPGAFQPNFWTNAASFGPTAEHWALYRTPGDPYRPDLLAAARVQAGFGGPDKFDMLIHPTMQGTLERPLLNFILRRLDMSSRPTVTDHPSDDGLATSALEQYGFEPRRSEINMRLDFNSNNSETVK